MKYLILIHSGVALEEAMANGLGTELHGTHGTIIGELQQSGEFLDTSELATTGAKVVRATDGLAITDGPYAETSEWVGGFYLVDCVSIERVVEIAARFVEARYAGVEIRPLVEHVG